MKNIWKKFFGYRDQCSNNKSKIHIAGGEIVTPYLNSERTKKIEKGAKDFADRFESVMKELANG